MNNYNYQFRRRQLVQIKNINAEELDRLQITDEVLNLMHDYIDDRKNHTLYTRRALGRTLIGTIINDMVHYTVDAPFYIVEFEYTIFRKTQAVYHESELSAYVQPLNELQLWLMG